jgi:hypothetical protein
VLEDSKRIKRAPIAKFFVESSKSQIRIKEWTPTKRDIKRGPRWVAAHACAIVDI